jgi:hypothetical protein
MIYVKCTPDSDSVNLGSNPSSPANSSRIATWNSALKRKTKKPPPGGRRAEAKGLL